LLVLGFDSKGNDDTFANLGSTFYVKALNKDFSKLRAKTHKVKDYSVEDRLVLFNLFNKFYENASLESFLKDFNEKDKVIVLYDKNDTPQGFSTIKIFDQFVVESNKTVRVFFSGDTIVHPDFWGKHNLNIHIALNMFKAKIMSPHRHTLWLLLTKGYKTYLLLTNSFDSYYPRLSKKTPQSIQILMNSIGKSLYSKAYDETTGLVKVKGRDKLASFVAPIDADLCIREPKINFFQEKNPSWLDGEELLCVGNISFYLLFFFYPKKIIVRQLKVISYLFGFTKKHKR